MPAPLPKPKAMKYERLLRTVVVPANISTAVVSALVWCTPSPIGGQLTFLVCMLLPGAGNNTKNTGYQVLIY